MNDPIMMPLYAIGVGLLLALAGFACMGGSSAAGKPILVISGLVVSGGILVFAAIVQDLHTSFGGSAVHPVAAILGIVGGGILIFTIRAARPKGSDSEGEEQ